MSTKQDATDASPPALGARLAAQVRGLRTAQGLSIDALAARSGVSRSMISLVERGQSSPTAVVLDKLAAALGTTLGRLFDAAGDSGDAGAAAGPLARAAAQPVWKDPASGYVRRQLSPPAAADRLQLAEVRLPVGAQVHYDTPLRARALHQQIWLVDGQLEVRVGPEVHTLAPGDCLAMSLDAPIAFRTRGRRPARYLVAIAPAGGSR